MQLNAQQRNEVKKILNGLMKRELITLKTEFHEAPNGDLLLQCIVAEENGLTTDARYIINADGKMI